MWGANVVLIGGRGLDYKIYLARFGTIILFAALSLFGMFPSCFGFGIAAERG
jgi:hypothetical protein